MSKEMLEAFRILEEDKGIKKEDIIDAVVESLRSAYRRRYGQSDSVAIDFNEKTGDFTVYTVREVVDEVFDSRLEISLKDALAINSAYELGDKIKFEEAPGEFGRVAAQSAKQQSWKKCVSKHVPLPTIHTKSMNKKSCQVQLNVLITASFMSILAALKPNCQNKTKFLEKFLLLMTVLKSMSTKWKTTLVELTSLLAVATPEMIKRLMEQRDSRKFTMEPLKS